MITPTMSVILWRLKMQIKRLFLVSITCVLSSQFATASEAIILSGAETSKSNSYYYFGYISPLPASTLGNGFVQRIWIDHLTYEYIGGGGTTEAKAPGVAYSLGYQKSLNDYSFGAYIGAQDRTTKLSPNDPTNKSEGNNLAMVMALELTKKFTDTNSIELMASNSPEIGYWSRIRFITGQNIKFGPEYSVQGNDSYRNTKLGLFIGNIPISQNISYQIKIGHSKNDDSKGSTYIGIDFTTILK